MLVKARRIRDSVHAIRKIPAAASARTRGEAKRKRVEVAPAYLRARVEHDEELPQVEVRGDETLEKGRSSGEAWSERDYKKEELRAVADFVAGGMKAELVVELLQALEPLTAAGEEGDEEDGLDGDGASDLYDLDPDEPSEAFASDSYGAEVMRYGSEGSLLDDPWFWE